MTQPIEEGSPQGRWWLENGPQRSPRKFAFHTFSPPRHVPQNDQRVTGIISAFGVGYPVPPPPLPFPGPSHARFGALS